MTSAPRRRPPRSRDPVIHEAIHFQDTMSSTDDKYTITPLLAPWGRSNPNNADSIAGYVVDGDY
ncbi:hypothetical protein CVS37_24375 [Burkholderia lata]|nr:hypothetical protein CVS37_24375 [Burkholderia lata]